MLGRSLIDHVGDYSRQSPGFARTRGPLDQSDSLIARFCDSVALAFIKSGHSNFIKVHFELTLCLKLVVNGFSGEDKFSEHALIPRKLISFSDDAE